MGGGRLRRLGWVAAWLTATCLLVLVRAAAAEQTAAVAPEGQAPALSVPATLAFGSPLTVTGTFATTMAPGSTVTLERAYGSGGHWLTLATATTAADGSFAFPAFDPTRNLRLRVLAAGRPPLSAAVIVEPAVSLSSRSLSPGRTLLSLAVGHAASAASSRPLVVWWYVAPAASNRYRLAAQTGGRASSPSRLRASLVVDPPAGRFSYRVCLNPPWEAEMGAPDTHGGCPRHGFTTGTGAPAAVTPPAAGHGDPAPRFPSPAAISAAVCFLDGRAGDTALAVLDSSGHLSGTRMRAPFQTASVIKVMFLTAYLQRLAADGAALSGYDESLLHPMIHISDNEAASAVLARVGEGAVERVAREAGMSAFDPSTGLSEGPGWWAYSLTDAADQARFFAQLQDLIPEQFYPYARGLMEGIEPSQSWGFPPVARPRWRVFFKTGALPSEGLFNEVARLERDGESFTVAVLTTGDPSMAYGEETIEGVAARLLGG